MNHHSYLLTSPMGFLRSPQMVHRRPLAPINSLAPTPMAIQKSKPTKESDVGNESYCLGGAEETSCDVSLAEELRAARQRREKLRLDREKVGRALEEMELALERGMKDADRREKLQRKVDLALRRLILLVNPHHFLLFENLPPPKSLREKERERKAEEEHNKASSNLVHKVEELRSKGTVVKEIDQISAPKEENIVATVNTSSGDPTNEINIMEDPSREATQRNKEGVNGGARYVV